MSIDYVPEIIFFDSKGMISIPKTHQTYTTQENKPFEDKLLIVGYIPSRKNAEAYFLLRSITNGVTYPMFPKLLVETLQRCNSTRGALTGNWVGVKINNQYSLKFFTES